MPAIKVTAEVTPGSWGSFRFEKPFRIGRLQDCELFIDNSFVSRAHAEVVLEKGCWLVRDLGSANGVFLNGKRLSSVSISGLTTVRLGIEGPEVRLEPEEPRKERARQKKPTGKDPALARYITHYFSKPVADEQAGEHTMFIRQAFAQVEHKRQRKSVLVIAALVVVILVAALLAYHEHSQLLQQRKTAEDLFYAIKAQDVDLANLDSALTNSGRGAGADQLNRFRTRRQAMEKSYDDYLATLQIYNPKLTERQRLVLRVARIFGECELDMPPDFEAEIDRYIEKWKSSGRLRQAIATAQQNGYAEAISKELLARGLPPQFFYLALQESGFNAYAVGPPTRKGFAKGMWQFIPETAVKYNLHLGPLVDTGRPDPADDRHNVSRETKAAAQYLQDLYGTDAQASGFLVMACYNWGENQILPLVRSMPENPRERNFWKLLAKHRAQIPEETYNYVFYIASAAVIGENPRLFGFDFDNPLRDPSHERGNKAEAGPQAGTKKRRVNALYPALTANRLRSLVVGP